MAWFALSLRAPIWKSSPPTPQSPDASAPTSRSSSLSPPASPFQPWYPRNSYFPDDAMYMPRLPSRPADVYTVRIVDPSLRPGLLKRLREMARRGGGVEVAELIEGRGFIFSMPLNAEDPLTGYYNGGLLEEGCISVSKTVLIADETTERKGVGQSLRTRNDEEEEPDEEDAGDHPNLRLQWEWTEARPWR